MTQDAPLWPSILPNKMVTAWIPFDDVTPDNGAMWMLPGRCQRTGRPEHALPAKPLASESRAAAMLRRAKHVIGPILASHKRGDQIQACNKAGAGLSTLAANSARPAFELRAFGNLDLADFEPPSPEEKLPEARPCPVKRGEVHFHHRRAQDGALLPPRVARAV